MPLSAAVAPVADREFTAVFNDAASLVRLRTTLALDANRVTAIRTLSASSVMVALVTAVASMKLFAAVFNASIRRGFSRVQFCWLPLMQKAIDPEVSNTITTSTLVTDWWVSCVSLPVTSKCNVYLPLPW